MGLSKAKYNRNQTKKHPNKNKAIKRTVIKRKYNNKNPSKFRNVMTSALCLKPLFFFLLFTFASIGQRCSL